MNKSYNMNIDLSAKVFFPSYDFNVITKLTPLQYRSPTEAMIMCEESATMKTAAGYWFLYQYYLNSEVFLALPRALPTELKGIAV